MNPVNGTLPVVQRLQRSVARVESALQPVEAEIQRDLDRCGGYQADAQRWEKRKVAGLAVSLGGCGVLVVGTVVGIMAGLATLGAVPGLALSLAGLGLVHLADDRAERARLECQVLDSSAAQRRELLDRQVYPRLHEARQALHDRGEQDQGEQLEEG
ncbi:MAG: hypothetical protein AB1758_17920, partial [Candidatus Eremiobacterota bacterium]